MLGDRLVQLTLLTQGATEVAVGRGAARADGRCGSEEANRLLGLLHGLLMQLGLRQTEINPEIVGLGAASTLKQGPRLLTITLIKYCQGEYDQAHRRLSTQPLLIVGELTQQLRVLPSELSPYLVPPGIRVCHFGRSKQQQARRVAHPPGKTENVSPIVNERGELDWRRPVRDPPSRLLRAELVRVDSEFLEGPLILLVGPFPVPVIAHVPSYCFQFLQQLAITLECRGTLLSRGPLSLQAGQYDGDPFSQRVIGLTLVQGALSPLGRPHGIGPLRQVNSPCLLSLTAKAGCLRQRLGDHPCRRQEPRRPLPREVGPPTADNAGGEEDRRRQSDGNPPPFPFLFSTGLGFHSRQFSLSQSILDSGQVGRDSSGDNAGVAWSLVPVSGQAIAGQGDQLGIGVAGVEPVQGVGQGTLRGVLAHLLPGFASERRLARQDLAEDRAQAKDVGALVDLV